MTDIETLTKVQRASLQTGDAGKALQICALCIIDAQTKALAEARAEVERLENLFQQTCGVHHSWVARAMRADEYETQLAAAKALLGEISESNNTGRSWRGAIRAILSGQPAGLTAMHVARRVEPGEFAYMRRQPAAPVYYDTFDTGGRLVPVSPPSCACRHPEEPGKHGATMCEIDEDEPAAPAWSHATAAQSTSELMARVHAATPVSGQCERCGRWFPDVDRSTHMCQPAAPDLRDAEIARLREERDEARKQRGDWAEREYAARTEADGLKREVARLKEALAAAEEKYNRCWRALDCPPARYAPMIGAPDHYMGMAPTAEGAWCRCEDVKIIVALATEAKTRAEAAEQKLADAEQQRDYWLEQEERRDTQKKAAEARVRELEQKLTDAERRFEQVKDYVHPAVVLAAEARVRELEAEVARLKEALVLAEESADDANGLAELHAEQRRAADARVRELEEALRGK